MVIFTYNKESEVTIMPHTESLGVSYMLYDIYVKETEKSNKKPVSFFKFLIGIR